MSIVVHKESTDGLSLWNVRLKWIGRVMSFISDWKGGHFRAWRVLNMLDSDLIVRVPLKELACELGDYGGLWRWFNRVVSRH